MVSEYLPDFLSTDSDARRLLQWDVMVRTGNTAVSYEWRQGCVYSLAAPVILVDGSDAPPSPTDPNVVVASSRDARTSLSVSTTSAMETNATPSAGFTSRRLLP